MCFQIYFLTLGQVFFPGGRSFVSNTAYTVYSRTFYRTKAVGHLKNNSDQKFLWAELRSDLGFEVAVYIMVTSPTKGWQRVAVQASSTVAGRHIDAHRTQTVAGWVRYNAIDRDVILAVFLAKICQKYQKFLS